MHWVIRFVKSRRSWKNGWVNEGLEKEEVDLIHSCQVCLVNEIGEIREPPG